MQADRGHMLVWQVVLMQAEVSDTVELYRQHQCQAGQMYPEEPLPDWPVGGCCPGCWTGIPVLLQHAAQIAHAALTARLERAEAVAQALLEQLSQSWQDWPLQPARS